MPVSSPNVHPFTERGYHNGVTRRTTVECRYPWSSYSGSGVPTESDIEFIHPQNPPVFEFSYHFNRSGYVPYGQSWVSYDRVRFVVVVERLVGSSWERFDVITSNSNVCFSERVYPEGIYRWYYYYQKRDNNANISEPSHAVVGYRYFRIDNSYSRLLPKRRWDTIYQMILENFRLHGGHPVLLPDWYNKVAQAKSLLSSTNGSQYLLHHLLYFKRPNVNSFPSYFHENNPDALSRLFRERFEGLVYSFDPDSEDNSSFRPTHKWPSDLFYGFPAQFPDWQSLVDHARAVTENPSLHPRLPYLMRADLETVYGGSNVLSFMMLCSLAYVLDYRLDSNPTKKSQLLENIEHCITIYFRRWFNFDDKDLLINDRSDSRFSVILSDDYYWREVFACLSVILDLLHNYFEEDFLEWFIGNLIRFWYGVVKYYCWYLRVDSSYPEDPRVFSNKGYESHYNYYAVALFVLGCVLAPHIDRYVSVADREFYHLAQESLLAYIWLNYLGFAGIETLPRFGLRGGYHEGHVYHMPFLAATSCFRAYLESVALVPLIHPRAMDSLEDLLMNICLGLPRLGMGEYCYQSTSKLVDIDVYYTFLLYSIPCFYNSGVISESFRKITYYFIQRLRLAGVRYTYNVGDYFYNIFSVVMSVFRLMYTDIEFLVSDWVVNQIPPSDSDKFKIFPQTGRVYYRSDFSVRETPISGGSSVYARGLDLKYKCSPYGSNSHGNESNHHFLLSYDGYGLIDYSPDDGHYWAAGMSSSFPLNMFSRSTVHSNTILAARKVYGELRWHRYTQPSFSMHLRAGLSSQYQDTSDFVSFGGFAERHVLMRGELSPSHSSSPGGEDRSGLTEDSIDTGYYCNEYNRRFVVLKTDPPVVIIYDRVSPRVEPLAFAWVYHAISVPDLVNMDTPPDDITDGAGNFVPLGGLSFLIHGARRGRTNKQRNNDVLEPSDRVRGLIRFLPPIGFSVSVTPYRIWGTRPTWDSSGSSFVERYAFSDLRRLCSFGFVDNSFGRTGTHSKAVERNYINDRVRPAVGRAYFHTTHLFYALDDVIPVDSVYDPVTVIIPFDNTLYSPSSFSVSRNDVGNTVQVTVSINGDVRDVIINKLTGSVDVVIPV